jgi:hypothetical protein
MLLGHLCSPPLFLWPTTLGPPAQRRDAIPVPSEAPPSVNELREGSVYGDEGAHTTGRLRLMTPPVAAPTGRPAAASPASVNSRRRPSPSRDVQVDAGTGGERGAPFAATGREGTVGVASLPLPPPCVYLVVSRQAARRHCRRCVPPPAPCVCTSFCAPPSSAPAWMCCKRPPTSCAAPAWPWSAVPSRAPAAAAAGWRPGPAPWAATAPCPWVS